MVSVLGKMKEQTTINKIINEGSSLEEILNILRERVENTGVKVSNPDKLYFKILSSEEIIPRWNTPKDEVVATLEKYLDLAKSLSEDKKEGSLYNATQGAFLEQALNGIETASYAMDREYIMLRPETTELSEAKRIRYQILLAVPEAKISIGKRSSYRYSYIAVPPLEEVVSFGNNEDVREKIERSYQTLIGSISEATGIDLSEETVREIYMQSIFTQGYTHNGVGIHSRINKKRKINPNFLKDPETYLNIIKTITGRKIPASVASELDRVIRQKREYNGNSVLVDTLPDYLRREHGVEIEFTRKN